MKLSSDEYSIWEYKCKKSGDVYVQSEHKIDPTCFHVYLVKKDKLGRRWVLPIFKINKESSLFQEIRNEAALVHKNIKAKNKGHIFRAVSLMVACNLLSEELSPQRIKKDSSVISEKLWIRSKTRTQDLKVLINANYKFGTSRIKATLKYSKSALLYPFGGTKIFYPPKCTSEPAELIKSLPNFKNLPKKAAKKQPVSITKETGTISPLLVIEDMQKGYVYIGTEKLYLTEKQISLIKFMQQQNGTFPYRISTGSLVEFYNDKDQAFKWPDKFRGSKGQRILRLLFDRSVKKYIELKIPIQSALNNMEHI